MKVPCIKCGDVTGVMVSLANPANFQCEACSETFTSRDVKTTMDIWYRALAWLATMPKE